MLITSSLGANWSTLPLTNSYLPLVQSAARYLAGANMAERNVSAGQELVATFIPPLPPGVRAATVNRPDGSRDTCDVTTIDQRSEARYARTDLPGLYAIRVAPRPAPGTPPGTPPAPERVVTFSVAPPATESDLDPLAEADWKKLETRLGFPRVEGGEKPLAARLSVTRGGSEYWLAALAAVMGLLVIELALTRAWSGET
jgi:hypothetical protein